MLGFQVRDIDGPVGSAKDSLVEPDKYRKGVIVSEIILDSLSSKSGLMKGDLIYSLNGEQVQDKKWFEKNIRKGQREKALSLRVYRAEESLELVLPLNN
jgi:S1-C subfamily serine protease